MKENELDTVTGKTWFESIMRLFPGSSPTTMKVMYGSHTLICVIIGECHYFDQNRPDPKEPIVNKTLLTPEGPFTLRENESVKTQAILL